MGSLRGLSPGKLAVCTSLGAALACTGAMAVPGVTRAQATPIRHVVVIYLENHSFDNLLGFWCDTQRGRCPDGGMPSSVRLSNGAVVTPSTARDTVPTVDHSVAARPLRSTAGGWTAGRTSRTAAAPPRPATAASADTGPRRCPTSPPWRRTSPSATERSPWQTRPPGSGTWTWSPRPPTASTATTRTGRGASLTGPAGAVTATR
jgi:hypothetical protein